jgi:hypothetical protein
MKLLEIASSLKENECTLNIFAEGKLILRMGKKASPGLLSPFGPIEINDLKAVLKLLG